MRGGMHKKLPKSRRSFKRELVTLILTFLLVLLSRWRSSGSLDDIGLEESGGKISLLLGVLMTWDKIERRHLIRTLYPMSLRNSSSLGSDTVRTIFVIGEPRSENAKALLKWELEVYGDIMVLDGIEENMNNGKSFEFLRHVHAWVSLNHGAVTHVGKVDDDTWLVLPNILATLHSLHPYNEVYYGREVVLPAPFNFGYHTGMAYFLSWDLVEWIATSPIPAEMAMGHEDHLVGQWFIRAGWQDSLRHWISDGEFIDYPRTRGTWACRYTEHTRAVHQLKGMEEFVEAARWFMNEGSREVMSSELSTNEWHFPDEQYQKWPDHLKETWNRGQTEPVTWVTWG